MKKLKTYIFVIFGLLFLANSAWAAGQWDFKTTDDNDRTLRTEFGWDDTPFAYFFVDKDKFLPQPTELDFKLTWLYDGEEQSMERFYHLSWDNNLGSAGNFRIWEAPGQWDSIKQVGDWQVRAAWSANIDGEWTSNYIRTADFTVTPEPISAVLFLLGGAGMAVLRKSRNKAHCS